MIKEVTDTQESVGIRNLRGSESGMPVFDKAGILLGSVANAYDPTNPVLERVASTLASANVPPTVVTRFRQEGCLEVYAGAGRSNYYVVPDQIAEVTNSSVFLNCNRVELIHL